MGAYINSILTILVVSGLLSGALAEAKSFREYSDERNSVNAMGSISAINYYQNNIAESKTEYVIIDKTDNKLIKFSTEGDIVTIFTVSTFPGDEMEQGGSGVYSYAAKKNDVHYGYAESDQSLRPLLKGDLEIPPGTPIYLLPKEDSKYRFRVWNNALIYNSYQVFRNLPEMNYSRRKFQITTSEIFTDLDSDFAQHYALALQNEKANLMELFNLDNDEYNMLAELAFGIMAPETNFGTSFKYKFKQSAPILISGLKGNGFDTSQNSQGPTQIKNIPEIIREHYGIEKDQLSNPTKAAIATLGFVATQLRELRNMAHFMKNITEENLQDYMYYLYNGRRYEIKNGSATPEQNLAIQKIKEAISHLHIEDLD